MKKKLWFLCLFVLSFFSLFLEADAATAKYTRGALLCSNKKTGAYTGKQPCNTSTETNVYLKYIDGEFAYCPQVDKSAPNTNVTVKSLDYGNIKKAGSWTENKALVAGQIIKILNAREDDSKNEKYMYISAALNTYLDFTSSHDYTGKVVTNAINEAKSTTFYTSSTLVGTPISMSFDSGVLQEHSSGYYFGKLNVTLKNEYTGDIGNIKYTVASCNGCTVYTDQAMTKTFTGQEVAVGQSKTLTLYVKANSGLTEGSVVSVTMKGSLSISYPIAVLWRYSAGTQALVTLGDPVQYNPTKSVSASAVVPTSDPETKYVSFSKVDPTGSLLAGADVTISFPSIGKSCSTSSGKGCSFTFDDDVTSVSYTITEVKAPSGYIISEPITSEWKIGSYTSICYRASNLSDEDKTWEQLSSIDECNAGYHKVDVCLDKDGNVVEGITTSEACTSNTESTEGSGDGVNSTQVEPESDTGEDSGTTEEDTTGSENTTTSTNTWGSKCYHRDGTLVDDEKCNYDYVKTTANGTNLYLTMTNELNSVSFSKRNSSNQDIEGAKLKVCSKSEYDQSGTSCTAYTTVSGSTLSWYSTSSSMVFHGFEIGTYYLIEEEASLGYILNKEPVEFSVDETGKVTLGEGSSGELDEGVVVIKNEITKISISKNDIATSQEVPGATITICEAVKVDDEYQMPLSDEGICGAVILADGSYATWVSTDKVHSIVGLPAGSYYLVEEIAPDGYATAESILFILNEDGTLTDKDGNLLSDNKLVMYDKKIEEVKTGMFSVYVVLAMLLLMVGIGGGTFYYMNKRNGKVDLTKWKFRKRKLHKNDYGKS